MSDTALGYLLAVIGSLSFGTYILPRKLSKLGVLEYQYWLAATIAPLSVGIALLAGQGLYMPTEMLLLSLGCGPLWTFGSLSYSSAVDHLGVARSTPIKNLAPAFAAAYGIVFFREYTLGDPISLAMTLCGVLLMVSAAFVLGRASAPAQERALAFERSSSPEQRKRSFWLGALYSMGAAFFYGAYSVPMKIVLNNEQSAATACAWLGIGVLATTFLVHLFLARRVMPPTPSLRELRIAQTAGAIWTSGQVLGTYAMLYIPMSISWPVSNLSTLVAVAWGIWVFKEVHLEKHLKEVYLSLGLYIAGLALLALAAPAGHV